jgi:hypothetical protein
VQAEVQAVLIPEAVQVEVQAVLIPVQEAALRETPKLEE